MSRPESREIYQIAKMNMKLTPLSTRISGKFAAAEYEYSSAFDLEFMVSMPCHVLSIARYRIDEGFCYQTGTIDTYELLVVYEGAVKYRYKETEAFVEAGEAIYINTSRPAEIEQEGTGPLELLILSLSGMSPMSYYTLITKNRQQSIHLNDPKKLDSLLDKIVYYMKYPTNKNNVLMVDTISGIFTELYLNISGEYDRDAYYNHPQWFVDTINYIESKSLSNVTIQKIAEELGVSESHYHKIFREYTGTTPYQYLLKLRISSAQSLLVTTEHQIKYIAYTVGFNSVNHFISHFKEATGCTPAEYRKLKKKGLR